MSASCLNNNNNDIKTKECNKSEHKLKKYALQIFKNKENCAVQDNLKLKKIINSVIWKINGENIEFMNLGTQ